MFNTSNNVHFLRFWPFRYVAAFSYSDFGLQLPLLYYIWKHDCNIMKNLALFILCGSPIYDISVIILELAILVALREPISILAIFYSYRQIDMCMMINFETCNILNYFLCLIRGGFKYFNDHSVVCLGGYVGSHCPYHFQFFFPYKECVF